MRLLVPLVLVLLEEACATPLAYAPAELLCASTCPAGYSWRDSYGVEAGAAGALGDAPTAGVSVEATHKARCKCDVVKPAPGAVPVDFR